MFRQVRMPRWATGHVVLTGDAPWCPTGLLGVGTSLALTGGYVLAGELAKPDDYTAAFAAHERVIRPFAQEGQSFTRFFIRLLWPHTWLGLGVLRGRCA